MICISFNENLKLLLYLKFLIRKESNSLVAHANNSMKVLNIFYSVIKINHRLKHIFYQLFVCEYGLYHDLQ